MCACGRKRPAAAGLCGAQPSRDAAVAARRGGAFRLSRCFRLPWRIRATPAARIRRNGRIHRASQRCAGPECPSLLSEGSPGADATGVIDYAHRFAQGTATYGGTVEVFHGIIVQHVLGLPRPGYPGSKVLVSRTGDRAAT